jgi:hypothetical protein
MDNFNGPFTSFSCFQWENWKAHGTPFFSAEPAEFILSRFLPQQL